MSKREVAALKSFKKDSTSSLLAASGIISLNMLVLMLNLNSKHSSGVQTEVDTLTMHYATITFIVSLLLIYYTYRMLKNENLKRYSLLIKVLAIITGFNLATFVYARQLFSLILIVPVLMFIYMIGSVKPYLKLSK